jgi:polysaccharide biosynthesis/export protein
MFRACDIAMNATSARRRARSCVPLMRPSAAQIILFSVVTAMAGCRTPNYTARSLPVDMQAPAMPPSAALNVEQMAGAGTSSSQIGSGDLVAITIVSGSGDEKVTPIPARVGQDGSVMVPLIGPVPIGGLEPVAAEQRIAAAAIERGIYRQPYVTLTIAQRAVNRVTVMGSVTKPGVVELPCGASDLASALAAAGGLSNDAGTQVEILRRTGGPLASDNSSKQAGGDSNGVKLAAYQDLARQSQPPNVGIARTTSPQISKIDLADAGAAGPETRKLDDRDVVMVLPREKRVIHVAGLVAKPNQFELTRDKDIHVLDAIAMAGGTTSLVADKVFIIRRLPNMSEPAVIKVSMSAAKRNGDENLRLAAGDMVSVESTMSTMTLDTVGKFFRVALGLNGSVAAL